MTTDEKLPTQSLVLPFPMRGGKYMAQIVIPRDMTVAEANRLCAFITSLCHADEPPVVAHPGGEVIRERLERQ